MLWSQAPVLIANEEPSRVLLRIMPGFSVSAATSLRKIDLILSYAILANLFYWQAENERFY